jgi:ketosteroid isomerase-like protein
VKRYIIFVVLGTALLAACGGLTGGSFTAMHASAIRDSVQTTLDTFRRYSAAGQWDSLADLYANDADFRFLDQGMVQYRSPGEIRNALRRVAPGTKIETTYRDTKIVPLAPGVAAVATAFHTKFVEHGRASREFGGVLDLVLVHREGGWKILIGHSSTSPQ